MSNEYLRLADVSELITKGTTPTTLGFPFTDRGIGFLRVQNIEGGQVLFNQDVLYIDEKTHSVLKRSWIKPGDVLVSIAGSIGRAAVVPNNAPKLNCNQAVAIVRIKDNVFQPYLRYWLESSDAQSQMRGATVTGTISNLSLTQLGNLKVPLPPIAEQKRIAAILDKAEELRGLRRKAVGELDTITQSIFLEMFGDPVTNLKGNKVVRLSDVTTRITDGVHQKPNYTESGVPFISVKNITTGSLRFDDCKFISQEDHEKLTKRCRPERHDILYTKVGATYGRPALVNTDVEFSIYVSVCLIKPKRDLINPLFLCAALGTSAVKTQADRRIKGIGVPDLHLDQIQSFLIPLPSMSEQQKFTRRVEVIEQLKATHRESLAQLDALFASLQHRAFRGEL